MKEKEKMEKLKNMCACGERDETTIRGYCMKCITKLKQRFDDYASKHAALLEEKQKIQNMRKGKYT